MPDPKKRIIVDGVDFSQLFYFPRIIREVAAAMQPPRLVIALLTVLLLIGIGQLWDGVTAANVHSGGILAGHVTDADTDRTQRRFQRAYHTFVPEDDWPYDAPDEWPDLDARTVAGDVRAAYREQRRDLDHEERQAMDQTFTEAMRAIDRARPRHTFEASADLVTFAFQRIIHGTATFSPGEIYDGLGDVFVRLPAALWRDHKVFTITYGLVFLILLAIGGGAIARMSACETAQQERLRVMDAFQFSMTNWPRLVLAPLLPLLLIAALALFIAVIGLIMYIPVIDILGGLLYIIMLMIGFAIAFLLIGYALAFPLFIPAVACENCDAPDAQQRAYAYIVSRPLHWLGYAFIGLIGLVLGFFVVSAFVIVILNGTAAIFGAFHSHSALNAAGGFSIFDLSNRMGEVLHPRWYHGFTAWLIGLWQTLVIALVPAYVLSYLISASTVGYLLMRRAADGQDIEEIWRPGLVPGTLAPMPRPRVEQPADEKDAGEDEDETSKRPNG